MSEPRICELWFLIVQRCAEVFGKPLPHKRLELGSRDREWGLVLNASEQDEPTLPRYSVAVSWGGLPAGVIDANGGVLAAGTVANERTFREWLPSAAPVHPELSGSVPVVSFRFVEFNPRRKSRGAEAARVEVLEDGESCGWLWMSERDIRNNVREFGDSEELRKALTAYRAPVPSPVSVSAG